MAHISLALMGPFEAMLDGEPITWFQTEKARALLAYLAVESTAPHGRHALAGLLWPHVPDDHALHSLSQALCNLRSLVHDKDGATPCLLVTPHTIQFNPRCDHWVDVEEFGGLARRSAGQSTNQPISQSPNLPALHHAISLYRGPFLEDLALADGVGFEEWAAVQRERLHRLMLAALRELATRHEASGEMDEALGCVWRQLELDPWLEEAHFAAMRLLAGAGRRSEALAQYDRCRRLLASELGVEPGAATTRLYEEIKKNRG